MTKQGFIKKLHKEKALQLVAPSDEIKTAYLRKSESFLASARLLLDNNRFEESVSMAYYSMYYSVLALFFATGIKCENHTAAIILLDDVFGIDSSALESAKTERIDKQYYVTSAPVRDDVIDLITAAESFDADLLDVIDRLTTDKREAFQKKLKALL
ncbi:MAG: HEPN domain-containing protein [Methanoregula sp.]|nr:HEPN domain-containing protein [Methanoregula sp.]